MSTGNGRRPGGARDTFASILAGCRPLFPPALLDSAGRERLLDRAGRLPRSVADASFGFEFHLGEPRPEADLRPGIERLPGGGEMYLVRQGISHVKVAVERGARTVAKAYAGMDVHPYNVASDLDPDAFALDVAAGNTRAN